MGMPYPRVIPHSDGAGVIDAVGEGVPASRVGERVWCFGAQSYRPFGTAAEFVVVPAGQAVPLPDGVSFEQGACLGIPGITAHRAVHAARGRSRAASSSSRGGRGRRAVRRRPRPACRGQRDRDGAVRARRGGRVGGRVPTTSSRRAASAPTRSSRPSAPPPRRGGSRRRGRLPPEHRGGRATAEAGRLDRDLRHRATRRRPIPFWPLVFKNVRLFFLGQRRLPGRGQGRRGTRPERGPGGGWPGFEIGARFPLEAIAEAHEAIEGRKGRGGSS